MASQDKNLAGLWGFSPLYPITPISSGFCLEAKQNSSTGPAADALWPVSNELLSFQHRAAHSTKASSTGTAWQHSWSLQRQGLHFHSSSS